MKIGDTWVNLHLARSVRISEPNEGGDRRVAYITWAADSTGAVPPTVPIVLTLAEADEIERKLAFLD